MLLVPEKCGFRCECSMCSRILSTLSHCSVPFKNWCLYRPTVLFLSETSVSIVPLFCSFKFKTLVSLLSSCSVLFGNWCLYVLFGNWCLYGPTAPLFCSFQKPVSLSSYCSVPFRNRCLYHPIVLFLSETGVSIILFCSFQKLVSLWSGGEETVRVLAFLCISKLVRLQPESTLEPTLKVGALSFVCGWVGAYGFVYVCACTFMCTSFFGISVNNNICRFVSLRLLLLASFVPVSVQQECMAYMTIDKFVVLMSLPLISFVHVCPASVHGMSDHM